MADETIEKINVYKLKSTVTDFAQFIKTKDGKKAELPELKQLALPEINGFDGVIEAIPTAMGTVIYGLTLDSPTEIFLGFFDSIEVELGNITAFRRVKKNPSRVELRIFRAFSEQNDFEGYDNCRDEMDLAIKRRP